MPLPSSRLEWQSDISKLPRTDWDAIIVGAGPAGCSAAWQIASEGHRVLLLDKEPFPRRKACGDGLISDALEFFRQHDLYDTILTEGFQAASALVISPSGVQFHCPGEYIVLPRERLDTILARKAVDNGATFAHGEIGEITYDPQGQLHLHVTGSSEPLTAQFVILATGSRMNLPRNLHMSNDARPHAFAMTQYVESSADINKPIINFDSVILPGFSWIWPLGNNRYNVGAGATYRTGTKPGTLAIKAIENLTKRTDIGRSLMRDGQVISDLIGAPLFCSLKGADSYDQKRILATGEAIGTTYPLTGEGVGKALESGALAGSVISEALSEKNPGLLANYSMRLNQQIKGKYRNYALAENWFARRLVNEFLCRRLSASPYLLNQFAEFAADRASVGKILSIGALLKSLWK